MNTCIKDHCTSIRSCSIRSNSNAPWIWEKNIFVSITKTNFNSFPDKYWSILSIYSSAGDIIQKFTTCDLSTVSNRFIISIMYTKFVTSGPRLQAPSRGNVNNERDTKMILLYNSWIIISHYLSLNAWFIWVCRYMAACPGGRDNAWMYKEFYIKTVISAQLSPVWWPVCQDLPWPYMTFYHLLWPIIKTWTCLDLRETLKK